MIEFELDTEYIELIKLLKATNLVGSGGEAKMVVSEGMVMCNGTTELRKRYKVRKGDEIEFEGHRIVVR